MSRASAAFARALELHETRAMLIYGINPVAEALRAGRVKELRAGEQAAGRALELIRAAEREGVPVTRALRRRSTARRAVAFTRGFSPCSRSASSTTSAIF